MKINIVKHNSRHGRCETFVVRFDQKVGKDWKTGEKTNQLNMTHKHNDQEVNTKQDFVKEIKKTLNENIGLKVI